MADITLSKTDIRRGRRLLWLTGAAMLSVVAAMGVMVSEQAATTIQVLDEAMFPGLGQSAASASSIQVDGPGAKVTLNKDANGQWVVAERDNYPANPDGVRAIIMSLADLTLVEKRTADPARHAELELTTGENGTGHSITITGADGQALAALVAGKVQAPASGNTPGTVFVRRAGEDQVWLARGGLGIPASIGATLDKTLFKLDRARIASVRVEPDGQPAYTLARPTPADENFALASVPDGKVPVEAAALAAPATAAAGLTFEDVVKAADVKVARVSTATITTFDGLVITVRLLPGASDAERYALIAASTDPSKAAAPADGAAVDPAAEAAQINARTGNWAYKLPAYVSGNLMPPLDTLVQDNAPTAPPADATPLAPGEVPEGVPEEDLPDTDEEAPAPAP